MPEYSETTAPTRFQQLQNQLNQPAKCPRCGSVWFAETTFRQYSQGLYSSGIGGDLSPISVMQQTIRVCLCGCAYAPNLSGIRGGRQASQEQNSFLQSMEAAKKANFDPVELDEKFQILVRDMVLQDAFEATQVETREQVKALQMALERIQGKLQTLEQSLSKKPAPDPEPDSNESSGSGGKSRKKS